MTVAVEAAMTQREKDAALAAYAAVRDYARSIRLNYGGGGQQVMDDLRKWLDAKVYEVVTAP
jgi:hypothetical protein